MIIGMMVAFTLLLGVILGKLVIITGRINELQRTFNKFDRNWRWEHGDKAYDNQLGKRVER